MPFVIGRLVAWLGNYPRPPSAGSVGAFSQCPPNLPTANFHLPTLGWHIHSWAKNMPITRRAVFALVLTIAVASTNTGCFSLMIAHSLRVQQAKNKAARPHFDSIVTNRLKVGDSIEHVIEVLKEAGLSYSIDRKWGHNISSILRTGEGCGIELTAKIDEADRVTEIKVEEFLTGP